MIKAALIIRLKLLLNVSTRCSSQHFCYSFPAVCFVDLFGCGIFCADYQLYQACNSRRMCESQRFIGNVPAGNLRISAAILCSGSLLAKSSRIFEFLDCYSISKKTFRHQQMYIFGDEFSSSVIWRWKIR